MKPIEKTILSIHEIGLGTTHEHFPERIEVFFATTQNTVCVINANLVGLTPDEKIEHLKGFGQSIQENLSEEDCITGWAVTSSVGAIHPECDVSNPPTKQDWADHGMVHVVSQFCSIDGEQLVFASTMDGDMSGWIMGNESIASSPTKYILECLTSKESV